MVTKERLLSTVEDVRMTSRLTTDCHRMVNQYTLQEKIGKGQHGQVFLCTDEERRKVALKVVRRNHPRDRIKLLRRNNPHYVSEKSAANSTEYSIRREVAIMKRCCHANIARLLEVIDDPRHDKIYMVMEYLSGGEVQWVDHQQKPTLSLQETRRIIRDVILGLEYLHHRGIIHRDIKPANLLWTEYRTVVKIIDFGVSYFKPEAITTSDPQTNDDSSLFHENDLLKRIGTPSFLAPEVVWFDHAPKPSLPPSCDTLASHLGTSKDGTGLVPSPRPPITKAIDVWSLAVTFYCLLFGHTPFNVPESANENVFHNEYLLYNQICTQDWVVDETMGSNQTRTGGRYPKDSKSEGFAIVNLLDRMLQKNPSDRVTLPELKRTPWILHDIPESKDWLINTSPTSDILTRSRWMRQASRKLLHLFSNSLRIPALWKER